MIRMPGWLGELGRGGGICTLFHASHRLPPFSGLSFALTLLPLLPHSLALSPFLWMRQEAFHALRSGRRHSRDYLQLIRSPIPPASFSRSSFLPLLVYASHTSSLEPRHPFAFYFIYTLHRWLDQRTVHECPYHVFIGRYCSIVWI